MVPGEVRGVVKAMIGFSQTFGQAALFDFQPQNGNWNRE